MRILTKSIEKKLRANHAATIAAEGENLGHKPVVKLFGGAAFTFLASEMDDENNLYGLADLGWGSPELGSTSFAEIAATRFPPFGLGVERDRGFKASKTLSEYASEARQEGRIRT